MSSTWIDARLNKLDNGRSHHFKGTRTVANGLTDIKTRWWSGCSLSIGAEYTRGFRVSPDIKIVSAWCRMNVRAVPPKLMLVDIYWHELFPCFGIGNSLMKFVQEVLDTAFMHSCGWCPESIMINIRNIFFLHFLSRCVRYNNRRNKLPSTQLVSVISLIWQRVSTSEGHLQVSSIKYIKGIVCCFVTFWTDIPVLQFDKCLLHCQISYIWERWQG
jgi:hypothetical protein